MTRIAISTLAVLLCVPAVHAQMFVATGHDTLRGLPGVEIAVDVAQPELAARGLDPAIIRGAVEQRLRAAGIAIYRSQADNPSAAKAFLYVHLNALELPRDAGFAVGVQVHLRQTVRALAAEAHIVDAMTWDSHNVVAVAADGLAEVRGEIDASVERFVRDWQAAHR
jgi:hypothetical protein